MNPFDKLKRQMTATLTNVMGYDVTWINSLSNVSYTAKCFFNYPDKPEDLHGFDYMPTQPCIEFLEGYFPNLKSNVDAGNEEFVTVDGRGEFFVQSVERKYDGDYLIAKLKEKLND